LRSLEWFEAGENRVRCLPTLWAAEVDLNRNFPDTYDGLAENAVQERVRLALPLWAPTCSGVRRRRAPSVRIAQ